MNVGRAAALVLASLAGAACGTRGPSQRADSRAAAPGAPTVLILAAGSPCLPEQKDLVAEVGASAETMKAAFGRFGMSAEVVRVRGRAQLEARLAGEWPPVVVYTGHGALLDGKGRFVGECSEEGPRCVSVACLGDERPMPFDEIAGLRTRGAPFSMLLIDACSSGHVDPRVGGSLGMFSISSEPIELHDDGVTILSEALGRLPPARLDRDCSGDVDDLEFFDALNAVVADGPAQARPRYRRQVSGDVRPLRAGAPRPASCTAAQLPSREPAKLTASADDPAWPGRYLLRGPVPRDGALPAGAGAVDARALVPLPCAHDLGQCFRIATTPGR